MEKIALIIFILWLPQALVQLLTWIYWIQVKEYRFDRFFVLLKSRQAYSSLYLAIVVIKFATLTLLILESTTILLALLLLALDIYVSLIILTRNFRRPVFTLRAKEIIAISLAPIPLIWYLSWTDILVSIATAELYLLVAPFAGIFLTKPFVERTKNKERHKAEEKLKRIGPIVIGVTGSYGKTSTKEFIYQLLRQRYKTDKTEKSHNTEFGVIRKINNELSQKTEYFVVEMGAYKKGEIARLANIVSPRMAIVTGIEPQHLALFGSIENIIEAKYELVDSLPKGGIAIFNYSNEHCYTMAQRAKNESKKVYGYAKAGDKYSKEADIVYQIIKSEPDNVEFEVKLGNGRERLGVKLNGIHYVHNLVGAILVAKLCGLDWSEIVNGIGALEPPANSLKIIKKQRITILDDSYNATPAGFMAALDYLKSLKSNNKIVITPGIIELGSESSRVHQQIGAKLAEVADQAILTNSDFVKDIAKGMGRKSKSLSVATKPHSLKFLKEHDTVVLLEGRVPMAYKSLLLD